MKRFETLGLSQAILDGVRTAGYDTPTPIQAAAIPSILDGRDMIGCAQTGTGKTAAFVLPMLDRLSTNRPHQRSRAVRALVVTPTRELAQQVTQAVRTYGKGTSFRYLSVFGGTAMKPQIQRLRQGVDIVVATPGRLLDHLDSGHLDLSRLELLVLDEADRMLDMGFIHDIRRIVAAAPKQRQTLLFSATMPREIQDLAHSILTNPEQVEIGARRNPAETVAQQVCPIAPHQKMDLLVHVLTTESVENVLVFSRTKHRADRIARKLTKRGFAATVMHSNRSQRQRERALDGFRTGRFRILVATDIAARGIDVDGISHVINYDTPRQAEDYIHRIGRTGRAQTTGDALTFVTPDEEAALHKIERHTGQRLERKRYPGFEHGEAAAEPASEGSSGQARRQWQEAVAQHRNGASRPGKKRRRNGRARRA